MKSITAAFCFHSAASMTQVYIPSGPGRPKPPNLRSFSSLALAADSDGLIVSDKQRERKTQLDIISILEGQKSRICELMPRADWILQPPETWLASYLRAQQMLLGRDFEKRVRSDARVVLCWNLKAIFNSSHNTSAPPPLTLRHGYLAS